MTETIGSCSRNPKRRGRVRDPPPTSREEEARVDRTSLSRKGRELNFGETHSDSESEERGTTYRTKFAKLSRQTLSKMPMTLGCIILHEIERSPTEKEPANSRERLKSADKDPPTFDISTYGSALASSGDLTFNFNDSRNHSFEGGVSCQNRPRHSSERSVSSQYPQ